MKDWLKATLMFCAGMMLAMSIVNWTDGQQILALYAFVLSTVLYIASIVIREMKDV